MGRAAKFINDPRNLPDIDWIPEHDISNSPDKNQTNSDSDPKQVPEVKKYGLRKNINPPKKLDL